MTELIDVVTGAFGYIGRYIAAQLVESGRRVKTITTHVDKPNPFGDQVSAHPYHFDQPDLLEATLHGVHTLYNTYWVRFEAGSTTFSQAVENTRVLFETAKKAGVQKIVHISVTQPSLNSPLPYYRGKALQEEMLKDLGIPYSIVRPTLVFGKEDILVNNIAWLLRKFPIFPIFGDGQYRVRPIYVSDLASIAINNEEPLIDAIGPEEFTFESFVRLIARTVSPNTFFVNVSPSIGIMLGNLISVVLRDILLTEAELEGLMANLLTSQQEPNGSIKFSEWIKFGKRTLGTRYASELARHFRWKPGKEEVHENSQAL
ncbi:MAG: NAD(P)H-binding protein [Chloroflexi bacterium]|nr:NAD(P)H-binding protein [Chloroflexota bacterium]